MSLLGPRSLGARTDPERYGRSRWLQLAFLAVAAVVVAEIAVRDRERPGRIDDAIAASAAPEAPELRLRTLAGEDVDLERLRGRVVAVNFWATWCGPCRVEIPELARLWREQHGHCFELLGVAGASGRADTERAARDIPYPVLFDADGTAVDSWDVRGFPQTFVVDPAGRVRRVFASAVTKETLAQAVEPLLPSSCPALR
jgi:cytochrome c biogenesis protein CcmG/thiol:disulfide interchange protein DsbE